MADHFRRIEKKLKELYRIKTLEIRIDFIQKFIQNLEKGLLCFSFLFVKTIEKSLNGSFKDIQLWFIHKIVPLRKISS